LWFTRIEMVISWWFDGISRFLILIYWVSLMISWYDGGMGMQWDIFRPCTTDKQLWYTHI
jgi:hypothetical protein